MNSDVEMHNMLLYDNYGEDGSVLNAVYSNVKFINVTMTNNTSYQNEYSGIFEIISSNIEIINSIFWNNDLSNIIINDDPSYDPSYVNIIYSNVNVEGEGNIEADPLFNADYTLQAGSPCIDAGIVIEDMDYCGEAPDMGAYEYITEDCEECPDSIEGDTNFDGSVNILDIVLIANCILSDSCDICFDLNADSELNILDIVLIVNIILDP